MKKKTSLFLVPALVFAFSMPAFAAEDMAKPAPPAPTAPVVAPVTATSTAIGAEVGGTGDYNHAYQGINAPVIAVGTKANVTAVGAYVGDSTGKWWANNNAKVTGAVIAIGLGSNDKDSNESITAQGAFIANSGYGNTATSSNIVLASDSWGSKGNTVIATGAEICGVYNDKGVVIGTAGNFNTATAYAPVFAFADGSNNSATAYGALISGTGSNNSATAYGSVSAVASSSAVFGLTGGSNNSATAIGASISGTGSHNIATSAGIVIAKVGR